MTTLFKQGSAFSAGALLVLCTIILTFSPQATAFQDRVVAEVWGNPIRLSEVRPLQSEADAKRSALGTEAYERWMKTQEKLRLSRRIWCELSPQYLSKHGLAPTAEEIKAYSSHQADASIESCALPNGELNASATLSRLKLDQWLYKRYGGRVVSSGSELIPVDARRTFLTDAREEGMVRIVDSTFAGVLEPTSENTSTRSIATDEAKAYFDRPWWSGDTEPQQSDKRSQPYVITTLIQDKQVRIECSNGNRFVIRKRPNNRWYEELMIPAVGVEVGYKTPGEAASARCSR